MTQTTLGLGLEMDLRHLRSVLAIMEEGTLGKASKRLNVSQPALTKSIQRLEESLGVRLFDRETRGMQPTHYAQTLQTYAKAICARMAEAQAQIAAIREGSEGLVTIAAPPVLARDLLPSLLSRLTAERPRLQFKIIAEGDRLYTGLLEGRFSMAFSTLYDELPLGGIEKHWIFDDRLMFVMRKGHSLSRKRMVNPEDMIIQRWALPDSTNWNYERIKAYFEQRGYPIPKTSVECRDPSVLREIIATSDHVGILSGLGIRRDLEMGRLRAVDLASPLMLRPIGLVLRSGDASKSEVKLIKGIATQFASEFKANLSTSRD